LLQFFFPPVSVNLTGIAGSNVFRANAAPRFITGMWILFGSLAITISLFIFQRYHFRHLNAKRARITRDWTDDDWRNYNATTTDHGDDRLDFVYTY